MGGSVTISISVHHYSTQATTLSREEDCSKRAAILSGNQSANVHLTEDCLMDRQLKVCHVIFYEPFVVIILTTVQQRTLWSRNISWRRRLESTTLAFMKMMWLSFVIVKVTVCADSHVRKHFKIGEDFCPRRTFTIACCHTKTSTPSEECLVRSSEIKYESERVSALFRQTQ